MHKLIKTQESETGASTKKDPHTGIAKQTGEFIITENNRKPIEDRNN